MMIENVRLRVSVVALFVDGDDVLLLHQMLPPEPDRWDLPGGGLEPHETIVEGLRREVEEETGLTRFEIGRLLTVTELFLERKDRPMLHTLNIIYQCAVADRSQPLFSTDMEEIGPKGIQWHPIDSLQKHTCTQRCWAALQSAGILDKAAP
ncbi:MAG: NUDIX domain-containing protein [Leptolyngbyaceae bacterium]|nr:NUDIX domain-containing protein [Leptolyngbyaceae bacterium]